MLFTYIRYAVNRPFANYYKVTMIWATMAAIAYYRTNGKSFLTMERAPSYPKQNLLVQLAFMPVITFAILVTYKAFAHQTAGFRLMFITCLVTVIGFLRSLDMRLFVVPMLILRLNAPIENRRYLLVDMIWYTLIIATLAWEMDSKATLKYLQHYGRMDTQ